MFDLPTTVEVDGIDRRIAGDGDYRAVLGVVSALTDPDLHEDGPLGNERLLCACELFYPEWDDIENKQVAAQSMMWFIDLGDDVQKPKQTKQIYDWEKDSHMIAAAVSKVYGKSIRSMEYLHWWDFVAAFFEIGEGQFSFICGIRNKLNKGKKLEKHEREFLSQNPEVIKLPERISDEEREFFDSL